ncbi:MAG: prepilin-type N-terminal cleavage/methylation domain-containing protein [Candidatus Gastranaerophilales bacterium]|nr:prepilin-type N-terminal cleavage/methylation domain-containing protein [Candidatus Gastranaerophilales bacterium]
MTKRFGFTLAEVLITLGIIGVVAAMTIPTLMNQTGQAEFKTGLKKAMSVLNQAITMNVALDSTDFSGLVNGNATGSIYSMFTTRMNVISTGASNVILGAFNVGANYTLFFNDGMAVTFPTVATACVQTSNCRLVVDVNGTKKPNRLSLATIGNTTAGVYDQFVLDFYNQQVMPHDGKAKYLLYN